MVVVWCGVVNTVKLKRGCGVVWCGEYSGRFAVRKHVVCFLENKTTEIA